MPKGKKDKKSRKGRYFNFKYLQSEIRGYGYEYRFNKFLGQLLLVFAAIIIAGVLYKLKPAYIISLCVAALLMLPFIIAAQFRYIYEQTYFLDSQVIHRKQTYRCYRSGESDSPDHPGQRYRPG
ncbi:MAG TPA: hypothetical protein VHQ24_12745 [Lachnospiraceae bacterium]|nr:hypothetical protein [Lachnospiraceae bacterium]